MYPEDLPEDKLPTMLEISIFIGPTVDEEGNSHPVLPLLANKEAAMQKHQIKRVFAAYYRCEERIWSQLAQ